MVSQADAYSKIRDKKSLYDAFLKNKYYMPAYKDGIVTIGFLLRLKDKKIWIPKLSEVNMGNCVDTPSKKKIAVELRHVLTTIDHA